MKSDLERLEEEMRTRPWGGDSMKEVQNEPFLQPTTSWFEETVCVILYGFMMFALCGVGMVCYFFTKIKSCLSFDRP